MNPSVLFKIVFFKLPIATIIGSCNYFCRLYSAFLKIKYNEMEYITLVNDIFSAYLLHTCTCSSVCVPVCKYIMHRHSYVTIENVFFYSRLQSKKDEHHWSVLFFLRASLLIGIFS